MEGGTPKIKMLAQVEGAYINNRSVLTVICQHKYMSKQTERVQLQVLLSDRSK
jgi:hypothetical protein